MFHEQVELVTPVEAALDYYEKLHEQMETDRHQDDDAQQLQQDRMSITTNRGSGGDYKFKVQKITSHHSYL